MNKWKWAFFALFALWLFTTAFLFYLVIDMSYRITYMREGYERTEKQADILRTLFPKAAYSKKDVLHLMRQHDKTGFIVETQCTVQLDGLRFEFNNEGTLSGITFDSEDSPEPDCARS